MEKEYDKAAVLSVGIFITLIGGAVCCLVGAVVSQYVAPVFVWLVIADTIATALWTLLSQYTKAVGRSMLFSVNNIVQTAVVLVLNIIFLTVLNLGIVGYMLGYIFSNLVAALMLPFCLGKDFKIKRTQISKTLVKTMLLYSLPLVLNGICWWLSSFTDRVMISGFLGTAENGLYAAASKIPHLVWVFVTIFCQAWQISANEEFCSEDSAKFYSKIYNELSAVVFLLASLLIIFCRPLNNIFLGSDYKNAWIIMPPLVLSTMFFSFASFLVSIYSANKDTRMAFVTNLVCVVSNIILNYFLIIKFNTIGAAIATATAYFILWIIRIIDTRKIVYIQYEKVKILMSCVILVLQTLFICLNLDIIITYTFCAAGVVLLLFIYWTNLMRLISFSVQVLKRFLER
jgi:O-antigen/teichoic acid export membrane protein